VDGRTDAQTDLFLNLIVMNLKSILHYVKNSRIPQLCFHTCMIECSVIFLKLYMNCLMMAMFDGQHMLHSDV
jgi:hypothetical protein